MYFHNKRYVIKSFRTLLTMNPLVTFETANVPVENEETEIIIPTFPNHRQPELALEQLSLVHYLNRVNYETLKYAPPRPKALFL